MNGAADLQALERDLDACLAEVMRLARSAAAATRDEWRALVESLTGERVALLPASDAANPAEVRAVLFAVQALYEARLAAIERGMRDASDEVADAMWTFRHRRLASLVTVELAAYVRIVAPRPSVASVFAHASRNVSVSSPVRVEARVQMLRCTTCGAPRRADGLYGNCLYCGRALFNPRQEID